MISSAELKFYSSLKQKKYREDSGKFLIEGFHLIEECMSSPYFLDLIIIRDDVELNDYPAISKKIEEKKIKTETLPEKSFNKLSETEKSQGIIGIVSKKTDSVVNLKSKLVIALDRITDPGNLGTIIRTAYWFGVESILVSIKSADIYNSKVVRASQGALFHVNIQDNINLLSELNNHRQNGYKIYLLSPNAKNNLKGINKNDKIVFVFGNESDGISEELINSDFQSVKIDGFSGCESLNVAVSAGIVLYEFAGTLFQQSRNAK